MSCTLGWAHLSLLSDLEAKLTQDNGAIGM